MKIEWIGHACFCITSETGLKIITDPYESGYRNIIKYGAIGKSGDIVAVSHDHGDHNYVSSVAGNPAVVKSPGMKTVKGIQFKGIAVYHDRAKGAERGPNIIFAFDLDGVRLAHLGDLGHPLSPEQLKELEGIEVLFAPTGGPAATLEIQEVIGLWETLKPRIVIPMHFKTARCTFPKYSAEDLTRLRPAACITRSCELSVTKSTLPKPTQIMILDHLR